MTQKELNEIIEKDSYFKVREHLNDYEEDLLLREVDFRCPICGKDLRPLNQKKGNRLFEIAHIYPNRPTIAQYESLKDAERLGEDTESLDNKIALCLDCHKTQDYQTSIADYNMLLEKKQKLLLKTSLQDEVMKLSLEDEIIVLLNKIKDIKEYEIAELKYKPVPLANKFTQSDFALKNKVKSYVQIYFPFIRDCLKELDGNNGFNQHILAQQIKSCFLRLNVTDDKSYIFDQIVEWILKKTLTNSREASEAVVSFYIQNCEVFDEISE